MTTKEYITELMALPPDAEVWQIDADFYEHESSGPTFDADTNRVYV